MFIFGQSYSIMINLVSAITDLLSDGSEYQADVSETDDDSTCSKSTSRSR